MIPEYLVTKSQAFVLLIVFFLLSCAQIINVSLLYNRRKASGTSLNMAYELSLCIHLWLMGILVNSIYHGWHPLTCGLWVVCPPLEPLFWLNAPIAFIGLIIGIQQKKPGMLLEIAFVASAIPPIMTMLSNYLSIYLILDASFFVLRTGSSIAYRRYTSKQFLSRTALIDAMQEMPEGIAVINHGHRLRFTNDTIRSMLTALNISIDFSTTDEIIKKIESMPGNWTISPAQTREPTLSAGAKKILRTQTGTFYQFAMTTDTAKSKTILLGLDVTEERLVQEKEKALEEQLLSDRKALNELMDHLKEIAMKDALVKVRSTIHDAIGQRLSIFHRLLEESTGQDSIDMMISTAHDMMCDINATTSINAQTELDAIIESFGLAGIILEVEGSLPPTEQEGSVLVKIIREATTNAVLHSQARTVRALIRQENEILTADITSDGEPLDHNDQEGTGITGMRNALNEIGGTLTITKCPNYKLHVVMKLPSTEDM